MIEELVYVYSDQLLLDRAGKKSNYSLREE